MVVEFPGGGAEFSQTRRNCSVLSLQKVHKKWRRPQDSKTTLEYSSLDIQLKQWIYTYINILCWRPLSIEGFFCHLQKFSMYQISPNLNLFRLLPGVEAKVNYSYSEALLFVWLRACSHEPGTVNYPGVMFAPGQVLPRVQMMISCPRATLPRGKFIVIWSLRIYLDSFRFWRMNFKHHYLFLVSCGTFYWKIYSKH